MIEVYQHHIKENKVHLAIITEKLKELAETLRVTHKINLKNMECFNKVIEVVNKMNMYNTNVLKQTKEKEPMDSLNTGIFFFILFFT